MTIIQCLDDRKTNEWMPVWSAYVASYTLEWRRNEPDGVSNHQLHDCLPTVYSVTGQTKHQSSASLAFVREIHRWPVNSPHKGPVTREMFPFDDAIMRKQFWRPLMYSTFVNLHAIKYIKWSEPSVYFVPPTFCNQHAQISTRALFCDNNMSTVGERTVPLKIIARFSVTQTPTGQWNIDYVAD